MVCYLVLITENIVQVDNVLFETLLEFRMMVLVPFVGLTVDSYL